MSESQASTPLSIPSAKEESYHPRTLTRSLSSYSTASGTSEGFPYTPKMGISDILTEDGRELGTEMTPSKPSNQIPQLILTENEACERQGLTPRVLFKNGQASPDQRSLDSPFGPPINISLTKQKSPSAHLGKFQCNYCMKRFSRPSSLRTPSTLTRARSLSVVMYPAVDDALVCTLTYDGTRRVTARPCYLLLVMTYQLRYEVCTAHESRYPICAHGPFCHAQR